MDTREIIEGYILHNDQHEMLDTAASREHDYAEYADIQLPEGWTLGGNGKVVDPYDRWLDLADAAANENGAWLITDSEGDTETLRVTPIQPDRNGPDDGYTSDDEVDFVQSAWENCDDYDEPLSLESALVTLREWCADDRDCTIPRNMTAAKFARIWNDLLAESQTREACDGWEV